MIFPPLPDIPVRTKPGRSENPPSPIERSVEHGMFPNELGVPVGLPELRIVTSEFCIALDTFMVHAEGVHAQLRLTYRNPTNQPSPDGHTFHVHPTQGLFPEQKLWRVGLELADGQKAFSPTLLEPAWTDDFLFQITGSGGGGQLVELSFVYISPVPPAGLLHLHVDFGDGDVRSVSADCSALTEASLMPMAIWDD